MQKLFSLLSAAFLFASSAAYSQSGSLDSTFGENGIVITDIATNTFDLLFNVIVQPDQKILAAGTSSSDFTVVRYLPDGTLDPDFGNNGIRKVDFGQSTDFLHGMTLQPDGKIILAGERQINNVGDVALARLNPNGNLDTNFGVGGKVTTDLGTTYEYATAVAIQTDGKIIAAGKMINGDISNADFAMVRYESNGDVDTGFGIDGIVVTSVQQEDEVQDIIILPDGKIVLGGFASVSAKGDYAMVRYLDDGTEDKSFGVGGKVITDLEGTGQSDYGTCMILDKDGKILLGGSANYNPLFGEAQIGIVRYDADGNLDGSFGIGGIYILDLGTSSEMQSMVQQPDGKYVIAGKSDVIGFKNQWLVARILNEGGLDTIFGNDGIVVTDMIGNLNEEAFSIALQKDSKIVLGGLPGDNTKLDFTLARYIADFIISVNIESGVSCVGIADAVISVEVSGGEPPYEYSLNGVNFQSSPIFNNLGPGNFTVTIRDSNGAGVLGSYGPIHIDDAPPPPPVQIDVVSNSITITVDGSGVYSYSIDGGSTFQSENTFTGLPDGTYVIYVLEDNGCIVYFGEAVVQGTAVKDLQAFKINVSPNPCKEFITIIIEQPTSSLSTFIFDVTGRLVSHEDVFSDGGGKFQLDVNRLSNGHYTLWLKNGEKWSTTSFIKL